MKSYSDGNHLYVIPKGEYIGVIFKTDTKKTIQGKYKVKLFGVFNIFDFSSLVNTKNIDDLYKNVLKESVVYDVDFFNDKVYKLKFYVSKNAENTFLISVVDEKDNSQGFFYKVVDGQLEYLLINFEMISETISLKYSFSLTKSLFGPSLPSEDELKTYKDIGDFIKIFS